jgi:N-acetylmuramic acid 6-phosphate etherase
MKRDTGNAPAFLGLDCGGTRSVAIYRKGGMQRRWEAGPGNVGLLSDVQLSVLFRTLRTVHKNLAPPKAIAIGMAGGGTESQRDRIRRAAAKVWPAVPCVAVGDLETALAAAEIDGTAGEGSLAAVIIVLSGTGSVFYGRNEAGKTARVGGWGHVIGDKGSAYEIGLRALKAIVYYSDRDGKVPPLGQRLLGSLLLNDLRVIPGWAATASKTEIAALARDVSAAAAKGDRIARDILEAAAQSLAEDAVTCASHLAARRRPVRFALTGSVLLQQPAFSRRVAALIRAQWPNAEVVPLKHEPALGAVELAQREWLKVQGSTSVTVPSTLIAQASSRHLHWTAGIELTTSPTEQRHPRSMKLHQLSLKKAIELMLREDEATPRAILRESKAIERAINLIVHSFERGGRLFYVGAGTSGRLGVLDASECPPTFRTDPEMVQGIIAGGQTALWRAVEGAEDDPDGGARAIASRGVTLRDTVVGIAASGRTPFVWGALDEARQRGAATVLLTLNPNLKIPREHRPNIVIAPDIGPEILTGSTRLKSGTATKLILNMFTTLAMVRIRKVLSNLMVDVKPSNVKLRDRAVRIVGTLTGASKPAAEQALTQAGWVIKNAVALLDTPKRKRRR